MCSPETCMDCIPCKEHHEIRQECLAAVREWWALNWWQVSSYEAAWESAVLGDLWFQ